MPAYAVESTDDCLYLSDIAYMDKSEVAWDNTVHLDTNVDGGLISVYIDGEKVTFYKGIAAHAASNVYYDISEYVGKYDYFTAYAGIDATKGSNGDGVLICVYTSSDGTNWEIRENHFDTAVKGSDDAYVIKVELREGDKYLRLQAAANANNSYDHAVWADAKLVTENYLSEQETMTCDLKTVAEYDSIIKSMYSGGKVSDDLSLTLLQREFVSNVGYRTLMNFMNESTANQSTVAWLMNSEENLEYYLLGGIPDGTYLASLTQLTRLLQAHQSDMDITEATTYGNTTKGDLYKRMIIALSLTHSAHCGFWAGGTTSGSDGPNDSDAVTRYEIYKSMYERGKLTNKIFETRTVEEMRFVMNAIIDDESIEWLRDYTVAKGSTNPYTYISYGWGYNYSLEQYYSEENKSTWFDKYNLWNYNITYQQGYPKTWIVFEQGGVCGALSKTGTVIMNSYGIPASCVGQPGHCAYIYQSIDSSGRTVWNLGNDISGWSNSGRTEKLSSRFPCEWGDGGVATYTSTIKPDSYLFLSQQALDDYENYAEAEKIMMLAKVYAGDNDALEQIYLDALDAESIHWDAMLALVKLYVAESRSEEEVFALCEKIANTYTYHPLPMYDLLRQLSPLLTSNAYSLKYDTLMQTTLLTATKATSATSAQYSGVKAVANALLGNVDSTVATFSYDGEYAGQLRLTERYTANGVAWDFSLDGGKTWSDVITDSYYQFSEEELEQISAENDLKIHIVGVDYEDENIYTIDITQSTLPSTLYRNDYENRIIGVTSKMEWRASDDEEWTSFSVSNPRFTGNQSIQVRVKATGTVKESATTTYTFTEDNLPNTRLYIYNENISVSSYSTQTSVSDGIGGASKVASNTIDGTPNTYWATKTSDSARYIIYKLSEEKYISGLFYVGASSTMYGKASAIIVYVSEDGDTWTQVTDKVSLGNNTSYQQVNFKEDADGYTSYQAQYVKVVESSVYTFGGGAAMIGLFEDVTRQEVTPVEIVYSTDLLTNQDVTATIQGVGGNITVTNYDNSSYVFSSNGSFTFTYVDENGNEGEATATVTWIDKVVPEASVVYDTAEDGSNKVVATLTFTKPITLLGNEGVVEDTSASTPTYTYTFTQNGSVVVAFADDAGNTNAVTLVVDWLEEEEDEEPDIDVGDDGVDGYYVTHEEGTYPVMIYTSTTIKADNEEEGIDTSNSANYGVHYTVTIPQRIHLVNVNGSEVGGEGVYQQTFSINVVGDLGEAQKLVVTPEKEVTLAGSGFATGEKPCTIALTSGNETYLRSDIVTDGGCTVSYIATAELTPGAWQGWMDVSIALGMLEG
jgi:hypothetical protein